MLTSDESNLWKQISDCLACPLCKNYFTEPSSLPCGHNFCRLCIEDFMFDKNCCPTCHVYSRPKDVSPSLVHVQLLATFSRFNDYLTKTNSLSTEPNSEIQMDVAQSTSCSSPARDPPTGNTIINNSPESRSTNVQKMESTLGADTDMTRLESQWVNVVADTYVTPRKPSGIDEVDDFSDDDRTVDGNNNGGADSDPFDNDHIEDDNDDDGVQCIPDTYAPNYEYNPDGDEEVEEEEDWVESYLTQSSQMLELSQHSWERERTTSPKESSTSPVREVVADTPLPEEARDSETTSPVYKKIKLSDDHELDGTSPLRSGVDLSYDSVMNAASFIAASSGKDGSSSSTHSVTEGVSASSKGWVSPQVEPSSSHSQLVSPRQKASSESCSSEYAVVASTPPVGLTQQSEAAKCHSATVISQLETSRVEEEDVYYASDGAAAGGLSSMEGYRSSDGESYSQMSSVARLENKIQRRKTAIAQLLLQQNAASSLDDEEYVSVSVADTYYPSHGGPEPNSEDDHTTVAPQPLTATNGNAPRYSSIDTSADTVVFVDMDLSNELQLTLDQCCACGWITVAPANSLIPIPDVSRPNRKYVLLVHTVEKKHGHLLTDRTIQYLKSLCLGIIIADVTWLSESVASGRLGDPLNHEVGGTVDDTFFRSPYRARYANRDDEGRSYLLSNYTFTINDTAAGIAATSCPVSLSDVKWLIHMCNGELVASPPLTGGGRYDSYSSVDKKHISLVMELRRSDFDYNHHSEEDCAMSVSWLFDAIANQRIPSEENCDQYKVSVFS